MTLQAENGEKQRMFTTVYRTDRQNGEHDMRAKELHLPCAVSSVIGVITDMLTS